MKERQFLSLLDHTAPNLSFQNEPSWMSDRRASALEQLPELDLPGTNLEDWRRTDVRGLSIDQFFLPTPEDIVPDLGPVQPENTEQLAGLMMQQNGVTLDQIGELDSVYFADFQTALKEKPDLLREYMGQAIRRNPSKDRSIFDVMQSAFLQGGYVLYIPTGVVVEKPFQVFKTLNGSSVADFSNTLIIAEDNSQATVLELQGSARENQAGLHCGAVEIFVGSNAHLNFVQIQDFNQQTWNFSTQRALIQQSANLRWITACLGSRLSKIDQLAELSESGANVDMLGLAFAQKRQHLDVHTYQKHSAAHTTSDLLYQNVLTDRSRTVWRGMIEVVKGAQEIDAYQKNENLLLDKRARADTIPGLEILADEVRCTHGATAGPVDPEQVYYLMSRGLSPEWAERTVVEGFFEPILQRIPSIDLRQRLTESVQNKLAMAHKT